MTNREKIKEVRERAEQLAQCARGAEGNSYWRGHEAIDYRKAGDHKLADASAACVEPLRHLAKLFQERADDASQIANDMERKCKANGTLDAEANDIDYLTKAEWDAREAKWNAAVGAKS